MVEGPKFGEGPSLVVGQVCQCSVRDFIASKASRYISCCLRVLEWILAAIHDLEKYVELKSLHMCIHKSHTSDINLS